ncbi:MULTISPECIES: prepilin peptidase [unclassified Vibrio]|uniref:Prepilin peptidase n=1 Tax=Vibrio sp. HB236076 TaxID=3232307 RepID=A0AB39HG51_9VIBR|nr:prepilin peptidase [Vibrio sp. HB161653]MDP5253178.1 prepilin peptidase [Vibrio sp. HB161653]
MTDYLIFLSLFYLHFSYWDIKKRKIKNLDLFLFLMFQCAFLIYFEHLYWLSSLVIFVGGFSLFLLRVIAAGDVKLATIFALGTDMSFIDDALMLMALIGGIQATYYLIKHIFCKKNGNHSIKDKGIPYGVAICGGFYLGTLLTFFT